MINYNLLPPPSFGVGDHPFTTWPNAFTNEEMENIVKLGESLPKDKGVVGSSDNLELDTETRNSEIAWIPQNAETTWVYDRFAWILRNINGQFYKFDIYGFCEELQYTSYDDSYNGHYTWHRDTAMDGPAPPRKLSMVLQLTDPEEYDGGDLELFAGKDPAQVKRERGLMAIFPSYTVHRVSPVTRGTRKSLVLWACGPQFR